MVALTSYATDNDNDDDDDDDDASDSRDVGCHVDTWLLHVLQTRTVTVSWMSQNSRRCFRRR